MMYLAHTPAVRRQHERGFTLIEVLAALALTSMVFVSLNLAMTAVRQGVESARQNLGSQAAISTAAGIFRRDMAHVLKLRNGKEEGSGFSFDGSARRIIYPLSERDVTPGGGLFLVRLRVVTEGSVAKLIRDRAPISIGEAMKTGIDWRDPVTLLEGGFDIGFAYRAQRSGERGWRESWMATQAMPEQVRLTITDRNTGRLRVPIVVQSLYIDSEVECAAPSSGCAGPVAQAAAQ